MKRCSADAEFLLQEKAAGWLFLFLMVRSGSCFLGVYRWPGGMHRQGKGDGVVGRGVVREAQAEAHLAGS